MSRRGWNLRAGTPERARADAKIRAKRKQAEHQVYTEPEPDDGNPAWPSKIERQRYSAAFKEIRRRLWERPLILADHTFAANALPSDLLLDWESEDDVIEAELPTYDDWSLEDSPAGLLLHGPGRLPQIVDPAEVLQRSDCPPQGREPLADLSSEEVSTRAGTALGQ
jgi:hypothetical protein